MAKTSSEKQGAEKQTLSFEAAVEKLQLTVKKLESGEMNLEDSLKAFEEGVQLSRACQQHLSAAELRVDQLMKASADQPGSFEIQSFEKKN